MKFAQERPAGASHSCSFVFLLSEYHQSGNVLFVVIWHQRVSTLVLLHYLHLNMHEAYVHGVIYSPTASPQWSLQFLALEPFIRVEVLEKKKEARGQDVRTHRRVIYRQHECGWRPVKLCVSAFLHGH